MYFNVFEKGLEMTKYHIEFIRQVCTQSWTGKETCNTYHLVYLGYKGYRSAENKFRDICRQYPNERILFSVSTPENCMDIGIYN